MYAKLLSTEQCPCVRAAGCSLGKSIAKAFQVIPFTIILIYKSAVLAAKAFTCAAFERRPPKVAERNGAGR